MSRWSQDRILNGSSVQPSVDLAAAVRGEKPTEKPWRKNLICFTRHPSLAASLIAAGFQHAVPKRRWWSLWLRKHPLGKLNSRTMLSILLNRLLRSLKLLFNGEALPKGAKRPGFFKLWMQRHRRLFHQLTYLSANRLFIFDAASEITVRVRSQEDEDIPGERRGVCICRGVGGFHTLYERARQPHRAVGTRHQSRRSFGYHGLERGPGRYDEFLMNFC